MRWILLLFLITIAGLSFSEVKYLNEYPFKAGEKLFYRVYMLGMHLGYGDIVFCGKTNYNGSEQYYGRSSIYSTKSLSNIYKLWDRELNIFDKNYITSYYEKWINEGSWIDNMKYQFYLNEHIIKNYNETTDWKEKIINADGVEVLTYYTLFPFLMSIDYEYYLKKGETIPIYILHNDDVVKMNFAVSVKKNVYFDKNKINVYYFKETSNFGIEGYVTMDDKRLLIRLLMPPLGILGKMKFELIRYNEQSYDYSKEN